MMTGTPPGASVDDAVRLSTPCGAANHRCENRERTRRAASLALLALLALLGAMVPLQHCAIVTQKAKMQFIRVRSAISSSDVEITLENVFIETYKNRVTIDVPFTVDKTDRHPHPAFLDGDFHLSGRAPDIGLTTVAEVKNAASEPGVVRLLRRVEGTDQPLRMVGVWRLWLEHVGRAPEVQGEEPVSPVERTDPDHVFEIHPLIQVEGHDLMGSLRPVRGYRPPAADAVFRSLQAIRCRIVPKHDTTTIVTEKRQFNDVEFLLEAGGDPPQIADDGSFVNAAVLNLAGNRLVESVRMVVLKGSPCERALGELHRGQRLRVFGLPRIDLSAVAWRAQHSKDDPTLLELTLPYEIILVGVYKDRR